MRDDLTEQIAYWKRSSTRDLEAAKSLFAKRLYPQGLFFCHLAIEKLIKALVVRRTEAPAPFIHDLRRLAEIAGLSFDERRAAELDQLSTFNIAGRYADEKLDFYQRYNRKAYAERYLVLTAAIIVWLNGEFQNGS